MNIIHTRHPLICYTKDGRQTLGVSLSARHNRLLAFTYPYVPALTNDRHVPVDPKTPKDTYAEVPYPLCPVAEPAFFASSSSRDRTVMLLVLLHTRRVVALLACKPADLKRSNMSYEPNSCSGVDKYATLPPRPTDLMAARWPTTSSVTIMIRIPGRVLSDRLNANAMLVRSLMCRIYSLKDLHGSLIFQSSFFSSFATIHLASQGPNSLVAASIRSTIHPLVMISRRKPALPLTVKGSVQPVRSCSKPSRTA